MENSSGKNIRLFEGKVECWPWSEDERTGTVEVDERTWVWNGEGGTVETDY